LIPVIESPDLWLIAVTVMPTVIGIHIFADHTTKYLHGTAAGRSSTRANEIV
jgi:hypothetical protein